MWTTTCPQCGWTSRMCVTGGAAEVLGKLHEQDNPGHSTAMREVPDRESAPKKPVGEKL